MDNIKEGILYETRAAEYLESIGYKLLDRNVNYPRIGELDIIASDCGTLVIVEVKYRKDGEFGHPIESLTRPKVKKIIASTERYLLETKYKYNGVRFDVICFLDDDMEHIKNAFYGRWS